MSLQDLAALSRDIERIAGHLHRESGRQFSKVRFCLDVERSYRPIKGFASAPVCGSAEQRARAYLVRSLGGLQTGRQAKGLRGEIQSIETNRAASAGSPANRPLSNKAQTSHQAFAKPRRQ